ncbi:paralemmin 1a isoform X2 [Cebidichthys violaceus]|uniref:paralemmin 1a isoform X2 n=1 Tax=Cebidichthys violaceus TaxID=271503 RepID=UPI0035CC06CB
MVRLQRTDPQSDMEVSEAQQDRQQLLAEKRKWMTEMENKKRQLEDDRRSLQHLKSKALRERWLLDGAPSAGPEQDAVRRQLEQDEAKTRSLEETINRLEDELLSLERGDVTHTTVSSGSDKVVKVHKSPGMNKESEATDEMKRAMYSVEITVERDRLTGETRVLSTNTSLPVDFSHQGVKVYEDERKVVHEMNGEDGVQPLSFSEVEELLHKADEASMMSQTVATVTTPPTAEVQEEARPEITGLETEPGGEPSGEPILAEASAENPVTMVFMGYQSVEDEDQTKKVLGLKGTVKAELVLIHNGRTSPASPPPASPGEVKGGVKEVKGAAEEVKGAAKEVKGAAKEVKEGTEEVKGGTEEVKGGAKEVKGAAEEVKGAAEEVKKEKQPCKCCSIM